VFTVTDQPYFFTPTVIFFPELKIQVSFSARPSSPCLSIRLFIRINIYIFNLFSRITLPVSSRRGTDYSSGRGFKFVYVKGHMHPLPRGDNLQKSENDLIFFYLLKKQQSNLNYTWYKSSLGIGNSKLFK
jgi:hypothetical protein